MVRGYLGNEPPWQRKPLPPIPGVLSAISWVTGEEIPLAAFKPAFGMVFPQGVVLYHGTSPEAARAILREGFRTPSGGPVWFSSSFVDAQLFGRLAVLSGDRSQAWENPLPWQAIAVIEAYVTPREARGCLVSFHYPHLRVHCPAGERIVPHEMRAFVQIGEAKAYEILERE